MSIPKRTYTAPSLPAVQQKSEIVDREGLDAIQCDLDYAPQREIPAKSGYFVSITVLQATIVGTVAAWLVGQHVVPLIWTHVPWRFVASVALLVAVVLAIDTSRSLEENLIRLLKNIWIAIWASAAIAGIPFLLQPIVSSLWLLLVAMPVAVYFAYRFTTFGVHWITGHPRGDGDVMLQCRDIWQHRYEGIPTSVPSLLDENSNDRERWESALRAIKSHDYGFLWCFGAVLAAFAMTWYMRETLPASAIGIHAVTAILFGLFIAAIFRCGGRLPVRLLARMLLHWFTYDWDAQATPWMFQSPCGEMRFRRRWFGAVLATVAVAVNHLAGAYVVISVPLSRSLAVFWPEWIQPVLMVLVTAVCCLVVPVIMFALILCIIADPAISAFEELYSE